MTSLLDIAPSSRKVTIRETDIDITGISAQGIADLVVRFSNLKELLSSEESVTVDTIVQHVPEALTAIIASGTGNTGNKDAEKIASTLSAEEQADLLFAIVEETFPNGIGNFIQKVQGLIEGVGLEMVPQTSSEPLQKSANS